MTTPDDHTPPPIEQEDGGGTVPDPWAGPGGASKQWAGPGDAGKQWAGPGDAGKQWAGPGDAAGTDQAGPSPEATSATAAQEPGRGVAFNDGDSQTSREADS